MFINDTTNNNQVTGNMIKWVFVAIAVIILLSILIVYLTKKYFPAVTNPNRVEGSNANYVRQLSTASLPLYEPRTAPQQDMVQLPPPAYSPPEPAINSNSNHAGASRGFVAIAVNH
ncbi:hypothetical protein CONCODRAFT_169100 [Conidiobolus coronatus NRRL 28638]|uniref:Uncharacterized protein n=1 Tax=Conidiobolus coronatus (strain ATCC 28846 / CBS 209.66 / NRRL 28638) TaxID=796925 RepID=A0A137NSU6_CONC2|nr:hypothetical protein CONCODRAFT_169100 [Conidiobolus coronatus NRRL 28638]|eukprot:KXN65780.1 hypothetical protein CONCODRAFT_169100 [Conidiobolus coronatus NRRL 28638]